MKSTLLAGLLTVLFFTCTLNAQVEKADWEHDFMIGGTIIDFDDPLRESDESCGYELYYEAGYFLTDALSIGARAGGQYSVEDDVDDLAFYTGPVAKFHLFTDQPIVPYVGGQFNFWWQRSDYDSTDSEHENYGYMTGPLAGVRCFVNEATCLNLEYQYRIFGCDLDDIMDTQHTLMVGIGFNY